MSLFYAVFYYVSRLKSNWGCVVQGLVFLLPCLLIFSNSHVFMMLGGGYIAFSFYFFKYSKMGRLIRKNLNSLIRQIGER